MEPDPRRYHPSPHPYRWASLASPEGPIHDTSTSPMPLTHLLLALAPALLAPGQDSSPSQDDDRTAAAGTHTRSIEVGGVERSYLLHVPKSYDEPDREDSTPLVLMLHGRTSNGKQAASAYYGWRQLSDEEGFIVAFPTALGRPTSWKASWAGKPTEDSRFLAALIDELVEELEIDPDRVFMTGHSSGGFMSFSFAATHSEKIAAIGPVAGLSVDRRRPSAAVSVISFHGMADSVVPYGRNRWGAASAVDSAERFARHGRCSKEERKELLDGRAHLDRWINEESGTEVVLYSIEGGNHGWPRGGRRSLPATKLIWEFFKSHPRTVEASSKPSEGPEPAKAPGESSKAKGEDDRAARAAEHQRPLRKSNSPTPVRAEQPWRPTGVPMTGSATLPL